MCQKVEFESLGERVDLDRDDILVKMLDYDLGHANIGKLRQDLAVPNSNDDVSSNNFRKQVQDLIEDGLLKYDADSKEAQEARKPEFRKEIIDHEFNNWNIRITAEGLKEARYIRDKNAKLEITELGEEFSTIIESGTNLMRRIDALLDKTAVVHGGYEIEFVGIYNALQIEFNTVMNLFPDYNEAAVKFSKNYNVSLELADTERLMKEGNEDPEAMSRARLIKPTLDTVLRNAKKAKAVLNAQSSPIPPAEIERLGHLRKQLERISTNVNGEVYGLYIKNIELSITEAEAGHDLASAMISSRVFANILDQIWTNISVKPSEQDVKQYGRIKFIMDSLKASGSIDSGREDLEKDILASDKISRDYTSHRVAILTQHAEALRILGSTVTLLEKAKAELDK